MPQDIFWAEDVISLRIVFILSYVLRWHSSVIRALYGDNVMTDDKSYFIAEYFGKWELDVQRAENLLTSDQFFLEGLLVLSCYIGALGRLRYPNETKDWKTYKTIVSEYSGQRETYENIDLLFFYQWPTSRLANDKVYGCLKNYPQLVSSFENVFGTDIKTDPRRYQKREELRRLAKSAGTAWFDEANFEKYIELFSNNQILYEFVRCEAVHNSTFPLFNAVYHPEEQKTTYEDNHQIGRHVILTTVKNIIAQLKRECMEKAKWPHEL